MIRKAFRMSVHAGREEEYARRHAPIWRELEDVSRDLRELFHLGGMIHTMASAAAPEPEA
jgi:hypothetical protein